MGAAKPKFPNGTWDGLSKSRDSILVDRPPDSRDWDQIVAEVIATQQRVLSSASLIAGQSLLAGQPCWNDGGTLRLAQANDEDMSEVFGFVLSDSSPGSSAPYVTDGQITLSDWTAIAGAANLTPGAIYFLDPLTAGLISESAPSLPGHYVVELGKAATEKTLDVKIRPPIGL